MINSPLCLSVRLSVRVSDSLDVGVVRADVTVAVLVVYAQVFHSYREIRKLVMFHFHVTHALTLRASSLCQPAVFQTEVSI